MSSVILIVRVLLYNMIVLSQNRDCTQARDMKTKRRRVQQPTRSFSNIKGFASAKNWGKPVSKSEILPSMLSNGRISSET
jgi:hypothetical protein